jgi:hypothetical protein
MTPLSCTPKFSGRDEKIMQTFDQFDNFGCRIDGTREEYRAKALTNATDIGSCLGIPVVFVAYDQMSQATIRRKLYKKLSKEELKILREDFAKEDHSHEL